MQKHVYFSDNLISDKTIPLKIIKPIIKTSKYCIIQEIDNSINVFDNKEKELIWSINFISFFINDKSLERTDQFARQKQKTSKKLIYKNCLTHVYDMLEANFHVIYRGLLLLGFTQHQCIILILNSFCFYIDNSEFYTKFLQSVYNDNLLDGIIKDKGKYVIIIPNKCILPPFRIDDKYIKIFIYLLDALLCKVHIDKQQYVLYTSYTGKCQYIKKFEQMIEAMNISPYCVIEVLDDRLPALNWLKKPIDYTIKPKDLLLY